MKKRILSLLLALLMLASLVPTAALASTAYYINGKYVHWDDYSSSESECWAYAQNFYTKIWGTNFSSYRGTSDDSLRDLSKSEHALTADNLKAYVSNASLGASLRICNDEYYDSSDGWGHSQIIVQKDSNGFTVFEGGLTAAPHCREKYYTWSEYASTSWLGGTYSYIKYIKWPGAEAYSTGSETPAVSVTERVTHGYSVKISANYLLKNYTSELDTNADSSNYVLKKDNAYSLSCSEKVVLSNGTIRYKWVSSDTPPKTLWFEYDSSTMSVSLKHQYTEYNYEAAHPHKYYKKCSCGDYYYTGETKTLESCSECNPTGTVTYAVTGGSITFDKATGTVTDCDTSVTAANIPSKIDGVAVTSIGSIAFYNCKNLTNITIPNSVTSIGGCAFEGCVCLTSVTIPSSVTSIARYAFSGCTSLTSINVAAANTAYSSVDGVLFNKDKTELVLYPEGRPYASYSIPSSVTSIGNYAFSGCTSLTSISIPDSVTSIGDSAFRNCTSLTSVDIPNSVTSIGDAAFYDCTGLTSIDIPNSVTSIGGYAFSGCTGLTSITIPSSVTSIGGQAFSSCTGLTRITIPSSVTSIGNYAFSGCTSLTSISIPDSVTSIGSCAFYGCTSLASITIPNSVTSIGGYAFDGCTSLIDVSYLGSEAQWNAISIGSDNEPLTSANIHYNYHVHNYTAAVTAPTCTAQGYTTYTCTCGDSYVGSYVDAIDHSYADGKCTSCGAAEPKSEDGSIIVSTAKARAGSNVTVDISLKDNPGVGAITLAIDYDTDKLELVSFEDGGLTGWLVEKKAVWTSSSADSSHNGVILSLTFKVKEGVEDGTIPVTVSYSSGDICNNEEKTLYPSVVAGGVTVFSVLPGDINGDGLVNSLDLIRLKKYIADDATVIVGNGDINGDGKINSLDLIRLKKYIAGSDVEIH